MKTTVGRNSADEAENCGRCKAHILIYMIQVERIFLTSFPARVR